MKKLSPKAVFLRKDGDSRDVVRTIDVGMIFLNVRRQSYCEVVDIHQKMIMVTPLADDPVIAYTQEYFINQFEWIANSESDFFMGAQTGQPQDITGDAIPASQVHALDHLAPAIHGILGVDIDADGHVTYAGSKVFDALGQPMTTDLFNGTTHKPTCQHEYVAYNGLFESYDYCKHCDTKKIQP